MTIHDQNKQKFPDIDLLKNSKNAFLQDIYAKSFRYDLSDKQIEAAKKALAAEQSYGGKTPYEINKQHFPNLFELEKLIASEEYPSSFVSDILFKSKVYILSDKQISILEREYAKLTSNNIDLSDEEKNIYRIILYFCDRFSSRYSNMPAMSEYFLHRIKENKFTENDRQRMFHMLIRFKKSLFNYIFNELNAS